MAVDSKKVLQLIDDYQGRALKAGDQLTRNHVAFREIQAFRQLPGVSADESVAAAEHYLFARFMVSSGSVSLTQMRIMVAGYDGIKFVLQQTETTEKWMRHNPANPTSKVSAESVAWGMKGCTDGEADRLKYIPDQPVLNWNWDALKFGGATDKVAKLGKVVVGNY